jgi:hypothetical protein
MENKIFKKATLLARLAYKSDNRIVQELEANGLDLVIVKEIDNTSSPLNNKKTKKDLKFYIADDNEEGVRYFVVRGSVGTVENWIHNLAFWKNKDRIHWGFSVEAKSLLPHILPYQDLSKQQQTIGHSKGAALAHILAPDLKSDISIGVGTPFFAGKNYLSELKNKWKTKYYDIVHSLDIVSLITWTIFKPLGDVFYIDRKDNLVKNPSKIRNVSDTVLNFLIKRYGEGETLHDILFYHCYERYCKYFNIDHRKGR